MTLFEQSEKSPLADPNPQEEDVQLLKLLWKLTQGQVQPFLDAQDPPAVIQAYFHEANRSDAHGLLLASLRRCQQLTPVGSSERPLDIEK